MAQKTLVPLKHHSTTDWDFQNANWLLTAQQYISAPTSIRAIVAAGLYVLSRLAGAQCLPQGRMIACTYATSVHTMYFLTFRNQAALGSASSTNCYLLYRNSATTIRLNRMVGGVSTLIGTWTTTHTLNAWHRYRITWWNGVNEQNQPALACELEQEIGGEWVSRGILYDTANQFKDSATNRCGIGLTQVDNFQDDTEIWIPA